MSYGTIVNELARTLGRHIIAYDNLPEHGGCILYLDGPVKRIDITIEALEEGSNSVAAYVRQIISAPPSEQTTVKIGLRDGKLTVL